MGQGSGTLMSGQQAGLARNRHDLRVTIERTGAAEKGRDGRNISSDSQRAGQGRRLRADRVGLTLVFGTLGVVNFAHGALFMLGAFCAVTLQQRSSTCL
jgi:hypothetical protein